MAQTTAYGRVRLSEGTRVDCPFRFQCQYEDVETGLYYNRFRYYDPQEGGCVSQDPVGLLGGHVLYGYVDEPNTDIDPFGEINWGNHLKKLIGTGPPSGMKRPHAHHIVFKEGRGKEMKTVLADSKAILEKHGID